ncbi:hypothetical protein D9613_010561 [Agrocybe pediades]|uniref:Uncharacterized protein n=1 Tax=Agrocybe pediades TaxID=84607 RepID=A0A8H4VJA1_9AGAR|nr:hypothetical protein D9613_010561 [Agrocybe pediades]
MGLSTLLSGINYAGSFLYPRSSGPGPHHSNGCASVHLSKMPSRSFDESEAWIEGDSLGFTVGAYMFEVFLYGLYTSIFIFCMHMVWLNRRPMRVLLVAAALLLFGIATADMIVALFHFFRQTLNNRRTPDPYSRLVFFITNNIIADSLLIHRFHVYWFRRRRYIVVPCIFLFSSSLCGYLSLFSDYLPRLQSLYPIYLWMTLGLNITLTILIAVRFLWSARRARRSIFGSAFLYLICLMIIESGLIYSAYLLVHQLTFTNLGLNQVVAMVPTLIIIRASTRRLNHGNAMHEGAASVTGSDDGSSSTPVLDSIFSTVGTAAQMSPQSGLRLRVDNSTQTHLPQETDDHALSNIA